MRVQLIIILSLLALPLQAQSLWQKYAGKAGPTGWRCHVIQADPGDHGPDGINVHDWNGDGRNDVFVNFEEGKYSRLYFAPDGIFIFSPWEDYIEFKHGKCEDSGIGDLDNDGDIDYIANGGWVYFNPGKEKVRDSSAWTKMTLFDKEQRVPTVVDIDGDGLNDLLVGAHTWYKQPRKDKHKAENWRPYRLGRTLWPMNAILHDVDRDGDDDIVVPDRGVEVCWFENPGKRKVTSEWTRHELYRHTASMFMTIADLNDDHKSDFIITGGYNNRLAEQLIILMRTNKKGAPTYKEIILDQPCGNFPKGVTVMTDSQGRKTILVIPKRGDIWTASFEGDPMMAENWTTTPQPMPGASNRLKMDNAWQADMDGDGDMDILTTEENGGWGVIWFQNPEKKNALEEALP